MKRYFNLDERVLTNIILQAGQAERISRQRARYPVVDVPAQEFDEILTKWSVPTHIDKNTRGIFYVLSDVQAALKKLCLEKGIRPKLNPDLLRSIG
jgi:hypothetical protein